MRMLRFLLSYALLNIFALLAAMFLAQNLRVERLTFFGINFTINFVWILLGSVTFGFLAACLLLLPGRIAAHLHSWTLDHEAEELENQVGLLMQQREEMLSRLSAMMATQERVLTRYQRLLADHSQVVAELDKAKAKSLALATVAAEPRAARAVETATAVATARRTTSAAAPVVAAARTTAPVAAVDTATEPAVHTSRNPAARTPWDWTARALRDSAKARLSKSFARLLPEPAPPPLSQAAVDSQPQVFEPQLFESQLFESQLFEPGIDASADLAMVND